MRLQQISIFIAGLIFGMGLLLSGMTDPSKVQGFLDLFGAWDPSLALVMAGAIGVSFFAFRFIQKKGTTISGQALCLPTSSAIDRPLVIGGLLFGIGWGLAGFCPGPALVSVASGEMKALIFVAFMLIGMGLFSGLQRKSSS